MGLVDHEPIPDTPNPRLRAAWTTLDPQTRAALGMAAARALVAMLEEMVAERQDAEARGQAPPELLPARPARNRKGAA